MDREKQAKANTVSWISRREARRNAPMPSELDSAYHPCLWNGETISLHIGSHSPTAAIPASCFRNHFAGIQHSISRAGGMLYAECAVTGEIVFHH